MKKKLIIGIIVIIALFFVWRVCALIVSKSKTTEQRSGKPPVAVVVDTVQHGFIQEVRQLTGTVYPKYQYIVAPKVSGRVTSIRKRIGDFVSRGEVVAYIDDAEYQQSLIEAEAKLKIAQATLIESESQFELAKQEKSRVVSLQDKGIASPAELDAAISNYSALESKYKLAVAQVEQYEATLKAAKIRLGYTVLTASDPGYIGERFVDEGALLAPNAAVVSIVGIDSVIIRTTVVERDYGLIRTKQTAKVTIDAFTDVTFEGVVARIAPQLGQESRVAQIEIEVANDSLLLKPGMFAKVEVVLAQKENAQIVPSKAIVAHNGNSGVYIVAAGDSIAHYFEIQAGIIAGDKTEIIEPILQGKIVTLGQHLLVDGSPVILPKAKGNSDSMNASNKVK